MGLKARPSGAIAVTAAAVAVAFAVSPAQSSPPPAVTPRRPGPACRSPGCSSGETIRRNIKNGSEVTERLGNGSYRVTRCDRSGTVNHSMTVNPVRDPDGRFVLAPGETVEGRRITTLDYGDPRDPRWARVWRRVRAASRARGAGDTGHPPPDPAFDPSRRGVARAAAAGACDDGTFHENGARWADNRYPWRVNAKSFGNNKDTLEALKQGPKAWDNTNTNCDYGDTTKITPEYKGGTDHHAGSEDGVSTVDKGDIKSFGCEGALACARVWLKSDGSTAEADVRFSDELKWSNSGKDGAYDYRAVATHEFGHVIGLKDLDRPPGADDVPRHRPGRDRSPDARPRRRPRPPQALRVSSI